jgi:hypothetical protein
LGAIFAVKRTPIKRNTALRPVSAKRRAYKASDEGKAGKEHMGRVAQLPCLVCGAHPVEVHHEGKPRSDFNCLPLCPKHHRQQFGPGAYHYSPRAFYELHGTSEELLAKIAKMLQGPEILTR